MRVSEMDAGGTAEGAQGRCRTRVRATSVRSRSRPCFHPSTGRRVLRGSSHTSCVVVQKHMRLRAVSGASMDVISWLSPAVKKGDALDGARRSSACTEEDVATSAELRSVPHATRRNADASWPLRSKGCFVLERIASGCRRRIVQSARTLVCSTRAPRRHPRRCPRRAQRLQRTGWLLSRQVAVRPGRRCLFVRNGASLGPDAVCRRRRWRGRS